MNAEGPSLEVDVPPAVHAEVLRPCGIAAFTTLRRGPGVSVGRYAEFNLASHVGDDPAAVVENRARLVRAFALPSMPVFMQQVHGVRVWMADREDCPAEADAVVTTRARRAVAVLTADCLPIVVAKTDGSAVACVHAGWRGLSDNIIREAIGRMPKGELVAWIGPSISAIAYEVGDEVRERFAHRPFDARAFARRPGGKWACDLQMIAHDELERLGVREVSTAGRCTSLESRSFFSHRRDGTTGRMATIAWIL